MSKQNRFAFKLFCQSYQHLLDGNDTIPINYKKLKKMIKTNELKDKNNKGVRNSNTNSMENSAILW